MFQLEWSKKMAEEHPYDRFDRCHKQRAAALEGYNSIVERAREITAKMEDYPNFGISDHRKVLVADGCRESPKVNAIEADDWPTIKEIGVALHRVEQADSELRGAFQSCTMEQRARIAAQYNLE